MLAAHTACLVSAERGVRAVARGAVDADVVSTTSTSLVYPPAYYSPEWRDQLEAAAKSGNASFYASGIFPGFGSDHLSLLLATQSKKIRCVKATEVALNDHYPVADVMMDGMGFSRPLDFEPMLAAPGFIGMRENVILKIRNAYWPNSISQVLLSL